MVDFSNVKVGTTVTILVHAGMGLKNGKIVPEQKESSGRVVIVFEDRLILNMGGRSGIPGVCTAENFVRIGKARKAKKHA